MDETFGRYRILGEVARGACGIVYRARDLEMDRVVALKTLRSPEPSAAARERFLREARLAARLRHPHIVPVYEAGGRPYYTMPLLEGEPLRGPLPPPEACRLLSRVADAAAYAHDRGIVHRDLKPGNIVVVAGEPVVTDFGAARADDDPRLTQTGELLGTPVYMSPEQLRGLGKEADGKADVYSLGAILHELLTGRPPFEAENFLDLSARALHDPAPELLGFDPALAALVRSCLAKDAAERPDARTLARRLERWVRVPPRRRVAALALVVVLAGAVVWAGASPGAPEAAPARVRVPAGRYVLGGGRTVEVEEFWIDRQEAPARAGGFSYVDAVAYCLKLGRRVPTEDEWEVAALGGFGCRDMARNLAEWTATAPPSGPDRRVVRGGHWRSPPEKCTPAAREELPVSKRLPTLGVRCAGARP